MIYITVECQQNISVNLSCQLCEPSVIGYVFYVGYDWGKWSIDYTLDTSIKARADMKHIGGITTDREMYEKVEEVINEIRKYCGAEAQHNDQDFHFKSERKIL